MVARPFQTRLPMDRDFSLSDDGLDYAGILPALFDTDQLLPPLCILFVRMGKGRLVKAVQEQAVQEQAVQEQAVMKQAVTKQAVTKQAAMKQAVQEQ